MSHEISKNSLRKKKIIIIQYMKRQIKQILCATSRKSNWRILNTPQIYQFL